VASLVFHLGLLGFVVTRPESPAAPKQLGETLVFVDVTPPAPPLRPDEPELNKPEPPRRPPKPQATPRPQAPPPTAEPAGRSDGTPESDTPFAEAPGALPRAGGLGKLVLVPDSRFSLALDAGTLAASASPDELAPRTPAEMVEALARETLGRGRVERGLVHPYYAQLGKALLKNWDADRVARAGLKGLGEQFVENSKIYNQLWADRAAAYGRSGSPVDGAQLAPKRGPPPNERIQGLQGVDLEARKELGRQLASAFKATRRATIRVVQDREGKLLRVELVQPSNDSQVDQEALKDVRAAAEKLPRPPDEVVGQREQISSLWSFELFVSISPPIPVVTFEFDEALGVVDPRLPLDRRIYKKVRLVSVE
jgi:TonB family protein